MPRSVMTDADRWAIVNAPDDKTTAALARRLGTPYQATYVFRAKARQQGWSYRLTHGTCDTCGGVLLIAPHKSGMRRHMACEVERNRRRQARLRHENAQFRDTVYTRSRDRQDALQSVTRGLDTASRQRWSDDDKAYLWEHRADVYTPEGAARLARTLGRSYGACQRMLTRLHRRYRE